MACTKFGERAEIGIGGGAVLTEHQRLPASGRKRKFAPWGSSRTTTTTVHDSSQNLTPGYQLEDFCASGDDEKLIADRKNGVLDSMKDKSLRTLSLDIMVKLKSFMNNHRSCSLVVS